MDISEFMKNSLANVIFRSADVTYAKEKKFFLGIDEAGRGPVLGVFCFVRLQISTRIAKFLSRSDGLLGFLL